MTKKTFKVASMQLKPINQQVVVVVELPAALGVNQHSKFIVARAKVSCLCSQ